MLPASSIQLSYRSMKPIAHQMEVPKGENDEDLLNNMSESEISESELNKEEILFEEDLIEEEKILRESSESEDLDYEYLSDNYIIYSYVPGKSKENCPICFEEFRDQELIGSLTCLHKFHAECLNTWLGIESTCPICRSRTSNT